jgi:hypothetical protein
MIETTTVSGRPAQVAYIDAAGNGTVGPDQATLIKVLFTDAQGGSAFLVGPQGDSAPAKSIATEYLFARIKQAALARLARAQRFAIVRAQADRTLQRIASVTMPMAPVTIEVATTSFRAIHGVAQDEAFARSEIARALRARAESTLARLRSWDEGKHPRDPAGSSTGGQFTGGGAEASGEAEKPADKKKGKADWTDFAKDGIRLDNATTNNEAKKAKFVERWNDAVGEAPADFRKQFLGGLNGEMKIGYDDGADSIEISGDLKGENDRTIGTYTRNIDFDGKVAKSAYFKLKAGEQSAGVGKTLLKANVDTYQKLGMNKVEVYANIDVGGYAWAKYGYVPTASAWRELQGILQRKLGGGGGSAPASSGNTYTPESWEELSSDQQDDVKNEWMRSSQDDFYSSEVDNWRESGQALDDAKNSLAYDFEFTEEWAVAAMTTWREQREENGDPAVPFTDEQILDATSIKYDTDGEGRSDPEIDFSDKRLDTMTPQGLDPAQMTLPGIEAPKPHEFLTDDVRDDITQALTEAFNDQSKENADDLDPPDYLRESVSEYQESYWEGLDDSEKFAIADRHGLLPEIEIEPDEEDLPQPEPQPELPMTADPIEALKQLARSDNPKAIWAIADSERGKRLLLGTNWNGVLNLHDKDTMDRFNAYVGKKS